MFVFASGSYFIRNMFVYPKMREEQREECGEEIREVENDMVALSVGFMVSEVVRFGIHGELPEGEPNVKDDHEQWEAWVLYAFSIVFGVIALCFLKLQFSKEFGKKVHRILEIAKMTCIMAMAWCLLFWGQWEIFDTHLVKRENLARIVLALALTYYGMIQIFVLDAVADHSKSKIAKKGSRLLTKGFGLALAFAWEASFDNSIETMADGIKGWSPGGMKLLIACVLVAIVAPAWAKYILPKTMTEEEEEEKDQKEADGEDVEVIKPPPGKPAEAKIAPEPAATEAGEAGTLRDAGQAEPVGKPGEAWSAEAAK